MTTMIKNRLEGLKHQWAHNQSTPWNLVNLRIGVHVGAVELVTDINGKLAYAAIRSNMRNG